jgi:tetratricopeptide (TPR) repeat protein
LEKQESVDIFFCLDKYFELINDIQSGLKLSEFVCKAQEAYPSELRTGEIGLHIVMALDRLAVGYLQTQNYQKAKESYEKVVELTQELTGVEETQKQSVLASTYHQLGMVAQQLREYEQARAYYQQALDIFIEFGDRYNCARTYHQLGSVAQALREYEQARAYFQQALDIKSEFGDRYSQASTYSQLGLLAEELGELEAAKTNHLQDLQISVEFNDEHRLTFVLTNLTLIYQATQDESLLAEAALILNATVEELKQAILPDEDS